MDWKTIGNYVLLVGLFVAMVTMFNQVNGRLDTMNERIDALQTEMNRRFDAMQTEMNRRFDTMQAENQRQHDAMQEVLRAFEGRITRLEEKPALTPTTPNSGFLAPACWGRPSACTWLRFAPARRSAENFPLITHSSSVEGQSRDLPAPPFQGKVYVVTRGGNFAVRSLPRIPFRPATAQIQSLGHLEKCLVDSHRWREWQFAGMSVRK